MRCIILTTLNGSCAFWSNARGAGRGLKSPSRSQLSLSPLLCPVKPPSHSREKSVWQSLPSSEPWQTQFSRRKPTTPSKRVCLSLPHRARVSEASLGQSWGGRAGTGPRASSRGVGDICDPHPGLAASSSSLEGIGGWRSLQCRGLFSPPPRGSATSWPPVSPTHQRPAPRAPSGAADPAAGPTRAPDSAQSDCIPVVLAVSHGGSAPPSYLGSRRSPLIPSSWALQGWGNLFWRKRKAESLLCLCFIQMVWMMTHSISSFFLFKPGHRLEVVSD